MQVETYEVEEINASEASTMAADSEAIALCEKLGLKGQLSLTDKTTDTRLPYRTITGKETAVLRTICDNTCALEDYKAGPIPLRVLQVAAHAKEFCEHTAYLEVWYPADVRVDPVLVGRKERYAGPTYLLARWGESVPSLEVLSVTAKRILKARYIKELKSFQARINAAVASVDALVEDSIESGNVRTPYMNDID